MAREHMAKYHGTTKKYVKKVRACVWRSSRSFARPYLSNYRYPHLCIRARGLSSILVEIVFAKGL